MFSGIQGEGPHVGVRQIFVRLGGCDLRCSWCDTPGSLVRRGLGRFEMAPGSRQFDQQENPILLESAWTLLARLEPAEHHSVTFTGGEPLLQPEVVNYLAERTRQRGGSTYLETHGGRVRELAELVHLIDFVSMDIKLPSSSFDFVPLDVHAEFLAIASATHVFAKLVVTPDTLESEVVAAAEMIATTAGGTPLILQPVSPAGQIKASPSPDQMLRLQSLASATGLDVRVIPQTHKISGQM